jgi:hypothetical protein
MKSDLGFNLITVSMREGGREVSTSDFIVRPQQETHQANSGSTAPNWLRKIVKSGLQMFPPFFYLFYLSTLSKLNWLQAYRFVRKHNVENELERIWKERGCILLQGTILEFHK